MADYFLEYDDYEKKFSLPEGGEIMNFDPAKWAGMTQEQYQTQQDLEAQRNESATEQFYIKS